MKHHLKSNGCFNHSGRGKDIVHMEREEDSGQVGVEKIPNKPLGTSIFLLISFGILWGENSNIGLIDGGGVFFFQLI